MSFLDEEDIELNALDEFTALGWDTRFGPDISKGCADDNQRDGERDCQHGECCLDRMAFELSEDHVGHR